jgi:flagellar protein FlgJ
MLGVQGISSPASPAVESRSTIKGAADARLANMAKEFEATFLSLLLKEMRQTLDADGGFFPGDTGDVQGGLFDLYLGRHLADAGGVGLAAALVRQMQPPATPAKQLNHPDAPDARRTHGQVAAAPPV